MTTMTAHDVQADGPGLARCDVLGVGVSAVNQRIALATIAAWIDRRERHYVCITGVHGVMESQRDPALKTIHNQAGMVTPDGMPMVWAHWLHGNAQVGRVYGPDLMLNVGAESIRRGWRHFFFGGGDGVADLLARSLTARFPGLIVAGTHTPPFRPMTDDEDALLVQQINAARPDIVWVGLSTPKQEYWMSRHCDRLNAAALIGVGAAFDFHAGLKKQAPRWMQCSGLEWAYRLCTEPRRLWKRYLINNPLFVMNYALQLSHLKDFTDRAPHPPGGAESAHA